MKLSGTDAAKVVYGEIAEWKEVEGTKQTTDHSRWSVGESAIFQHIPTAKFYEFSWSVGATEVQDESPFEYTEEYEPIEVELRSVLIDRWMPVETLRTTEPTEQP